MRTIPLTLAGWLAGPSLLVAAIPAQAHPDGRLQMSGTLVTVRVQVDGRPAPLYPAPDGSPRVYLEARRDARYEVEIRNRSGERLGVELSVDGLNAISGARATAAGPGRMYVLDAGADVTVRGWRSSLRDVRRFTFVDEERSYAERTGQANGRMGWIEVAVYRERRAAVQWPWRLDDRGATRARPSHEGRATAEPRPSESEADSAEAQPATPPAAKAAPESAGSRRESYPGTGWGERTDDPATLVHFDPEPNPSDTLTLRYEYRRALVALGILPRGPVDRDRLAEREAGRERGFAPPPRF